MAEQNLSAWPPLARLRRHFRVADSLDEAIRSTGLHDFGDRYYAKGLAALMQSVRNEARLNRIGRLIMHRTIGGALRQRLLMQQLRMSSPELFQRQPVPPIIVTGLPRSGTTHLHRLLAQDPDAHAPPLWEMVHPVQPASALAAAFQRTLLKAETAVLRRLAPSLRVKHPVRADEPEECIFAMAMSFRTTLFWTLGPVYSYLNWYKQSDRIKKYREYRDVLQVLQARAGDRRLALKAPDHLGGLEPLFKVIPAATVVVCLRDPAETVPSLNSLVRSMHEVTSATPDPKRIAEANLAALSIEARLYLGSRKSLARHIVEIDYRDIVNKPLDVLARIYSQAGLQMTPALTSRFEAFLAANPRHKHGEHRYNPEDFGQTASGIRAAMGEFAELSGQ